MITDEQKQQEEHWRQLAELLGLREESPATTAPTPKAQVQAEVRSHPEEIPPAKSCPQMEPPLREVCEAAPSESRQGQDEPCSVSAELGSQPPQEETSGEAEISPRESSESLEGPSSREGKSRRGRRGRRGRGDRNEDRPKHGRDKGRPSPKPDEPEEDEENLSSPEQNLPPMDEDLDDDKPQSSAIPDDDDLDEEDTLSDWTVPSWTELIASLYRPER